MLRISGVNIPDNKHIVISLTYVYGIGRTTSEKILNDLGIKQLIRTKDLSADDIKKLRDEVEKKFRVEGELRHQVKTNVKRLKDIGCYKGIRHRKGLPVHGQRTKTNNRTVRGNKRMTAGSGRRSANEKT